MTCVDQQPDERSPQGEFLQLFSRHSRRLYEFILTLVMRHADADEIFQDTCLVLWKKFDTYDPQGSFYGWACRIAYLEILQLRRKNQRIHTVSDEALSVLADKAISHADTLNSRQHALEVCLQKLTASDRQLIDERYRQRRSPKEIAQLGSQSVYAVYRALARVHSALMNCVQRGMAREAAQ